MNQALKSAFVGLFVLGFSTMGTAAQAFLISPVTVTSNTSATDLFSANHLVDGSGLSGDSNGVGGESVTHLSDLSTSWVTDRVELNDYYTTGLPVPVLTFDLGQNTAIDGFAYWAYAANNNTAKDISIRFATEADGTGGFGTSITNNPNFVLAFDVIPGDPQERQNFGFSEVIARYVEVAITDNYFGELTGFVGGDRVGAGEFQFNAVAEVSEPASLLGLLVLGTFGAGSALKRKHSQDV